MIFQEQSLKQSFAEAKKAHKLTKEQFTVLEILGKGGFGRVMKVEFKKNRRVYAMKEMSKTV
jgi:serine/threonine kinase 32